MTTPISIASPHPAYLVFAQYQAEARRWVFRVFGPRAGLFGTFSSSSEAFAFVRESAGMADTAPDVSVPVR